MRSRGTANKRDTRERGHVDTLFLYGAEYGILIFMDEFRARIDAMTDKLRDLADRL